MMTAVMDAAEIGRRIRYWRTRAGFSVAQFAVGLGVDESAVRHWELGDWHPSLDNLSKICQLCGISPQIFFGDTKPTKPDPPPTPGGRPRTPHRVVRPSHEGKRKRNAPPGRRRPSSKAG
jgi:transcriptional regulator with XRE-family HTH domain